MKTWQNMLSRVCLMFTWDISFFFKLRNDLIDCGYFLSKQSLENNSSLTACSENKRNNERLALVVDKNRVGGVCFDVTHALKNKNKLFTRLLFTTYSVENIVSCDKKIAVSWEQLLELEWEVRTTMSRNLVLR